MHHLLYISEQHQNEPLTNLSDSLKSVLVDPVYQKSFPSNDKVFCFQLLNDKSNFVVNTNYYIGVDWLVPGKAAVYVESKLNDEPQVDFLKMLLDSLEATENLDHLTGLLEVDFEKQWISIPQQKDFLSPLLVVQFLMLLQRIVRKGLKKSYYRVTENLNSKIKGKILISQQIRRNALKNKQTWTICNYQEYGFNTLENQFLKLVLEFVSAYISQRPQFFSKPQLNQLRSIIFYCMPAFENVAVLSNQHRRVSAKPNVFFKEYDEAIKIGEFILKRFSYNINKASKSQTTTPPFWLDMSKLFELYVFGKLYNLFSKANTVTFHDPFAGGKETDILIRDEEYKCVIDCKYKPRYEYQTPSLADKRQLAGYTRLKSVYTKLSFDRHKIIPGLIIYSHQNCPDLITRDRLFETEMGEYEQFFKLGVKLPEIDVN